MTEPRSCAQENIGKGDRSDRDAVVQLLCGQYLPARHHVAPTSPVAHETAGVERADMATAVIK